jgi:hypothetical protein
MKNEDFCPITCTLKELEKQINLLKKRGEMMQARFYEGVKYHRTVISASGILG